MNIMMWMRKRLQRNEYRGGQATHMYILRDSTRGARLKCVAYICGGYAHKEYRGTLIENETGAIGNYDLMGMISSKESSTHHVGIAGVLPCLLCSGVHAHCSHCFGCNRSHVSLEQFATLHMY